MELLGQRIEALLILIHAPSESQKGYDNLSFPL